MQDDDKKQDTPSSGEKSGSSAGEKNQGPQIADNIPEDLLDDPDIDDADLEDIDLDDVDLDDDFEDVSWDDLEEEESADTKKPDTKKPSGGGFIKKNFTKILIGGAALGVIVIFFGTMSQPTKGPGTGLGPGIADKTIPENSGAESRPESGFMDDPTQLAEGLKNAQRLKEQQEQAEGLPPMPTPVQTEADIAEGEEEALTPMPDFAGSPDSPTAEPESTVDEKTLAGLTQEEVIEYQPFPSPTETEVDNPAVNYTEKENITIEPLEAKPETHEAQPLSPPATPDETKNIPPAAQVNPANTQKLAELETFLTNSSADTNAQIAALNSKIAELTATVEQLSRQTDNALDTAKKAEKLAASKAAAAKEVSKPAVAQAPAPSVPKPAPKTEAPKPTQKAAKPQSAETKAKKPASTSTKPKSSSSVPQWQLRGASEGQAMIGQRGTNELINVKVGENVRGLGKISFIGQENGKWVVRGTQGKITQ